MATLNVHEAMGSKVDREAVATLVLPQLWSMSMGPRASHLSHHALIPAHQISAQRRSVYQVHVVSLSPLTSVPIMLILPSVIKTLGSRVEQEHAQHLRDVRRIEQQTSTYDQTMQTGSTFGANGNGSGEVDFESLVKGTASPAMGQSSTMGTGSLDPWDEGWADSGDLDASLVSLRLSIPGYPYIDE